MGRPLCVEVYGQAGSGKTAVINAMITLPVNRPTVIQEFIVSNEWNIANHPISTWDFGNDELGDNPEIVQVYVADVRKLVDIDGQVNDFNVGEFIDLIVSNMPSRYHGNEIIFTHTEGLNCGPLTGRLIRSYLPTARIMSTVYDASTHDYDEATKDKLSRVFKSWL